VSWACPENQWQHPTTGYATGTGEVIVEFPIRHKHAKSPGVNATFPVTVIFGKLSGDRFFLKRTIQGYLRERFLLWFWVTIKSLITPCRLPVNRENSPSQVRSRLQPPPDS
jgi:hypothetical protein